MAGNERRDPFRRLDDEPLTGMVANTMPPILRRPASERRTAIRPSEKRRRRRRMGITFSDTNIPERLRELARRWGMLAPDGKSPNVSALVEYLLLPRLEAAEHGELDPPGE